MAKAKRNISHKIAILPEENQPFSIPGNWLWTNIDSINHYSGSLIDPMKQPDTTFELYSVPSSAEDYPEIITGSEIGSTKQSVVKNDVLLCKINPRINRVWKVSQYTKYELMASSEWIIVRNAIINPDYLMYCFRAQYFREFMLSNVSGVGGSLMRAQPKFVKNYPIPIAPIAEQKRIVDRIESLFAKLDEAKDKAQAVVDGFETRKAAILHKAFKGELTAQWRKNNCIDASLLLKQIDEEIHKSKKKTTKKVVNVIDENYMRLPSSWLIVDLDRISKKITDGEHKTPNRVDSYCGYYLLSARNIHDDSLLLEDVDYVDENEYEKISKRCDPQKGDVLISCSGSVGRTCVIDDDNNYCMVRSAAMVSICKCNARYIMYAIQSDFVQHQIKRLSKQTAQANLFIGAIAAINIPLPPLEEQDEIVRIIDSIISKELRTKNIAEDVLDQIDIMKKSILARAFRGELGTNDPTEESAVKLLKKVL